MIRHNKNMTIAAFIGLSSVFAVHSFKEYQQPVSGNTFTLSVNHSGTYRKVEEPAQTKTSAIVSRTTFSSIGCKGGEDVVKLVAVDRISNCGGGDFMGVEKTLLLRTADPELLKYEMLEIENFDPLLKTGVYGPEQRPMKYNLFPNPMTTEARIEIENYNNEPYQFELYDLSGKLLKREQNISSSAYMISRDALPTGVYIYRLLNAESVPVNTGKVVME